MNINMTLQLDQQLVEAKFALNGIPQECLSYEQRQLRHLLVSEVTPWTGFAMQRLSQLYSDNINTKIRNKVVALYRKISHQGIAIDQKELAVLIGEYQAQLQQDPFSEKLHKALGWLNRLQLDSDGKLRTTIKPYHGVTGRAGLLGTTPVNGYKAFRQRLITASKGYTTVCTDYTACEVGILAALSNDTQLQQDYAACDDLYQTLSSLLHKATNEPLERKHIKLLLLMSIYGADANSIGLKLKVSEEVARLLQEQVIGYYTTAFSWLEQQTITSYQAQRIISESWQAHVSHRATPKQVRNWPIQMAGMEIINRACLLADKQGLKVIGVVHDCIYIESINEHFEQDRHAIQRLMEEASEQFLNGFRLKTSVDFIAHG